MENAIKNSTKKYTVKDIVTMENHAELIDGEIIVVDKTTVTHQRAVSEIRRALEKYIENNDGDCEVFSVSVALYCSELCDDKNNFFLPDIMVVCEKSGIKDDGVHVAPKYVAEITSTSTRKLDYVEKMTVYAKIGVQEYWVVDLQRKVVVKYLSDNEFAPEMIASTASSAIPVHTYPGLEINLSQIFE